MTQGYVRLSVGIEHIGDTKADLAQALDAARWARLRGFSRNRGV